MPPLPRGRCTACRGDVAIRSNGDVREHKDKRHALYGTGRNDEVPTCPGTGKKPETGTCPICGAPVYLDGKGFISAHHDANHRGAGYVSCPGLGKPSVETSSGAVGALASTDDGTAGS